MALSLLLAMSLAATDVRVPPSEAEAPGLDGNWVSDCLPIGKGGRHGFVTRVAIHGERIEAHAQLYATPACRAPTFTVQYRGTVVREQAADGRMLFDHRVESILLTPQVQDVADQYNQPGDHGCGLSGWQVNVGKSVAGRTCGPFPFAAAGTTLFDAAWVDGGALRLGAFPMLWTNDRAEKRPARPLPPSYRAAGGSLRR